MTSRASVQTRSSGVYSVSRDRATLRKTVLSCAVLLAALLLAVVLMSLLGSEQLPARASLCAMLSFGRSQCALTSDQFDILFQIRLPRILLAAAVGGSLATASKIREIGRGSLDSSQVA